MRLVLFAIMALSAGHADTLDYTVIGNGGVTQGLQWIDNSGGLDGSEFFGFGYNPLPLLPSAPNDWFGSSLLSSSFTVDAGQAINVDLDLFQRYTDQWDTLAFGVLLENSQMQAVLFNSRVDGGSHLTDLASPPQLYFPSPSAGVSTSEQRRDTGVSIDLDGVDYNAPPTGPGDYRGSTEVLSSYIPQAGTYQLLFGVYTWSTPSSPGFALAVDSVTVPEPASNLWVYGMAILLAAAVCRAAGISGHIASSSDAVGVLAESTGRRGEPSLIHNR